MSPTADLALLAVGLPLYEVRRLRTLLGVDVGVWVAEYARDPYVVLALLSEASPPRLGTAIAQAFPRSPLVTAQAALDIDELSMGRFALGLGSQVKRANEKWHGLAVEKPIDQVRDYVLAVRAACIALSGGDSRYTGSFYHFDLAGRAREPTPARIPPIYLAAVQPRMARAAGEVADGLVGHMLHTPQYFAEQIMTEAARGAADAGRDFASFESLMYRCCSPTNDNPDAERHARRQIGFYAATKTYFNALATMGFAEDAEAAQRALSGGEPLALERAVGDRMLGAFSIIGDIRDCARQLVHMETDVTRVLLFPPYLHVKSGPLTQAHRSVIEVARLNNNRLQRSGAADNDVTPRD